MWITRYKAKMKWVSGYFLTFTKIIFKLFALETFSWLDIFLWERHGNSIIASNFIVYTRTNISVCLQYFDDNRNI